MKNSGHDDHIIGIAVTSELPGELPESEYLGFKLDKKGSLLDKMKRLSKRADSCVNGIREHVILGPKISETVKGKFSLGARILQAGGIERFFRLSFSASPEERIVKASQCYLSTTAGLIAGILFVSTAKIAFHSDKALALVSPGGKLARIPYKVVIPLRKIGRVVPSENSSKPNQKYIQIVTVDEFEFWFLGFVSYQKFLKSLNQTISEQRCI